MWTCYRMSEPLPFWLPVTVWSCKKLLILRKEITPNEAKVMTMEQIEQCGKVCKRARGKIICGDAKRQCH